jgi:hypothetical protein
MTPEELADGLVGSLVRPTDLGWDAARVFHSGIGQPDVIVQAADVDDVQRAVRYALAAGLPVGVRGGGHSAWGTIPGGVLIDLSRLADVTVDGSRVSVGGGAVWGAVARELAVHGLGISSGDTASVGVGGLTLGGGIGWMVRAWGLACDQLVGAQLVTAAGEVVETSPDTEPELFAALRGGGGNFGVVTRFDFAAHPLTGVIVAVYRVSDPAGALALLRDVLRDAPRELTVTYMDVPPMDPNAPAGASVTAVWAGDDADAARRALAGLEGSSALTQTEFGPHAYPDILLDMPGYDPEHPAPAFIGGNALLDDLDDDTLARLVAFRAERPVAVLLLRSLGGAYGDVPQEESVFPARSATWFAMGGAFDVPGLLDEEGRRRAEADWAQIDAASAGFYGNFTMSTDAGLGARMYPPVVHERLAAVKRTWDPGNLFARNVNVAPTA